MSNYFKEIDISKLDEDSLTQDLIDFVERTSIENKVNYLDTSNVYQENLFLNKSILQFEQSYGYRINICNVVDLEDGLSKMKKIFKDSDFEKHFYSRIIEHEDYYKIDYGSHHCFFRVTKGDK